MNVQLLSRLREYQQQAVQFCRENPDLYNKQFHPDLSPIGWHLGHCIFTEDYWIHEVLLENHTGRENGDALYNPLQSEKSQRGNALPAHGQLCSWAAQQQQENLYVLEKRSHHEDSHELMQNDFLLHFLVQHYAQHLETMQMVLSQAIQKQGKQQREQPEIDSRPFTPDTCELEPGCYSIGRKGDRLPYDNEYPLHHVSIKDCSIMCKPVSNSEYLYFIEDGGYQTPAYWSARGWQWREQNAITHPAYWRRCNGGSWYIDTLGTLQHRPEKAPVHGVSYFEADAFAKWAGGRLAHEYEWEIASQAGILHDTGIVWEWCRNVFFPYSGFTAFPYAGYSTPYYDGNHYTLKGGSVYTRTEIKRPTFRNYYQPDKNFLFAGIRLVFGNGSVDHLDS